MKAYQAIGWAFGYACWIFEYILMHQKFLSCPKSLKYSFFRVIFLLNTEPHAYFSVISRPFPTEESLKDEDIYNNLEDLIEYVWDSSLCGPITGVDRTWLFYSVAEPALLIIYALQGSGHPHVLVKGLALFLCYCQREQMSNSCWC